jgi:hypothetical protein
MPLRLIAIVAAFNEADVIEQTVEDLLRQGIEVYLIDNQSTDGTPDVLARFLGHGLLAIERLPAEPSSSFQWRAILARKEQLAASLEADWLSHHDADELRESPWPGMSFLESLSLVDSLGWNAVDFTVLNFALTHNHYQRGDDLRESFRYFEPARPFDKLQIKCWKKQARVDLLSTGGHEARFEGRSVFPLRFLTRHYPFRSQQQAERKVFVDRKPRFTEAERAQGWHIQYDDMIKGHRFVRNPSGLARFEAVATRVPLLIRHRGFEEEEERCGIVQAELQATASQLGESQSRVGALCAQLDESHLSISRLEHDSSALRNDLDSSQGRIGELTGQVTQLHTRVDDMSTRLASYDVLVTELRDSLKSTLEQSGQLQHQLHQATDDLASMGAALAQRSTQLAERTAELDGLDATVTRLSSQLDERTAERAELDVALAASREALARRSVQLDDRTAERDRLRADVGRSLERIEELLASRSWRFTAPLRALYRLVRRTR